MFLIRYFSDKILSRFNPNYQKYQQNVLLCWFYEELILERAQKSPIYC